MKKQEIKELEDRHAAGYSSIPADASEIDEWQSEQVWPEDEKFAEHDKASQHKMTTSAGTKVMEEALKRAAAIRHNLEARHHSDSTQDAIEDRQR